MPREELWWKLSLALDLQRREAQLLAALMARESLTTAQIVRALDVQTVDPPIYVRKVLQRLREALPSVEIETVWGACIRLMPHGRSDLERRLERSASRAGRATSALARSEHG
jgi:DNA-binding response OmpR family regulator